MRLCQFFCCGRKDNLVQIFLLYPNFLLVHRNKVSVTVYLFLALYGSTSIQSRLFLKNIKNFDWFWKQYSLGFFIFENQLANISDKGFRFSVILIYFTLLAILETQLANIPDRGFLFVCNTLLLYSLSPYSQTERRTECQIHSLCVGWRNLFSSCAVMSVFCSGGK